MSLRLAGITCVVASLACGARQTEDQPAPAQLPEAAVKPRTTATASPAQPTRKSLPELVASADSIFVGLVALSSTTRYGCQQLQRLYVQPLTALRGRDLPPRLQYLIAASPAAGAGCTGDELTGLAATAPLSMQEPMVLFVKHGWEQRGSNGPDVPPLYGTDAIGQHLIGAAPLEVLAEIGKHLEQLDSDLWLIPPLSPRRFQIDKEVATDQVTGLMWQRVGPPKPMREVPAQQYCKQLELAGHSGWRLPSLLEATSLYRHDASVAPAPANVFPKLKENWYWTGTDDDGAFVYSPSDGGITSTHYDDPSPYGEYEVLCVRSHLDRAKVTSLPGPRFLRGADFVRDAATRRYWHAAKPPLLRSLKEARRFCSGLQAAGKSDWRLPTLQEALTLVVGDPEDDYAEQQLLPVHDSEDAMWTLTRVSSAAKADEVIEVRHPGSIHFWSADSMAEGEAKKNAICVTSDDHAEAPVGVSQLRYVSGAVLATGADSQRRFFHERGGLLWTNSAAGADTSGQAEARYPSGQVAARGALRRGLRTGQWRFWDALGLPLATVGFADGVAVGRFSIHEQDEDNKVELEGSLHGGLLHGGLIGRAPAGKVRFAAEFCRGRACGRFARFNDKGARVEAGEFRDGEAIGEHLQWHDNGKPSRLTRYYDGELHGVSEGWHPNGRPSRRLSYRNGRRHGEQVSWYDNGATQMKGTFDNGTGTETHYHENGQPSLIVDYQGEVRTGRWFRWYDDGQRDEESHFQSGKQHGTQQSWHQNGQRRRLVTYQDGARVGPEKSWHDNGKLAAVIEYTNGIRAGELSEWDSEGRPSRTGTFRNGERHGVWTQYYEGKKVRETHYRDGETVDRREYFGD